MMERLRMPEAPITRPSLLIRLRNHQDFEAWSQFVGLYAPVIYGYLRKRGVQDADAADLTQVCLRQVAAHVGNLAYESGGASFRGWLFTIVRNKLRDFHDKPCHLVQGSGDSAVQRLLENQPAARADESAEWEREYQSGLFAWAAEQVRPTVQESTWEAFRQTAVEGKSGKEVADRLGMTVAAVYLAKSRVMMRLRAVIREAQDDE
jgi:RNA polymerase sigma-70 factor (ECF subfamily)